MRRIDKIIIHCSATRDGQNISAEEIKRWHTAPRPIGRGWQDIGYHYIIGINGELWNGRNIEDVGAHCKGENYHSIGICYVGGLDLDLNPKDTRNDKQKNTMYKLISELLNKYDGVTIHGHNEFANKACPCFDTSLIKNEL